MSESTLPNTKPPGAYFRVDQARAKAILADQAGCGMLAELHMSADERAYVWQCVCDARRNMSVRNMIVWIARGGNPKDA